MRIALGQLSCSPQRETNLQKALAQMEQASRLGAGMILFPELQFSPFFPQHRDRDVEDWCWPIDHPVVEAIRDKARALGLVTFPNLYLEEGDAGYDATLAIDADGRLLGAGKMVHIPQMPCFWEQDYYTPSEEGFCVFETALGRIGVVVCFDRHFPESIRSCALQGAELVVIPTANTFGEARDRFEWEVRVAAEQNGLFVAMCNRVGVEEAMHFCGDSLVAGPEGERVAKAGEGEEVLVAEIDLGRVGAVRRERPYLALRRPEAYRV